MKRYKTNYPGVFYREAERIGRTGTEKIYYVVFKKDGKVIEEKAGRQYADKMTPAKAAHFRGDRIEGRVKRRKEIREAASVKKWTLNLLWDEYRKSNPAAKSLKNEHRKWTRNVKDGLGKKQPAELVPLDIDRLRLSLQKAGKITTAARVLELIRRTINFGVNRGLIQPLTFKISIPQQNNQTTEDLSTGEITRLLKALDESPYMQAATLMRLALFTGMRKSELLRLKWKDIDLEKGFITIRDPKGGKDQTIPLNDSARDVIEAHPRDSRVFLFPGRDRKKPARDLRKGVDAIRKAAKLPKGFRPIHGLRHVFASTLASSGKVDMYTLQKLLTHKSPHMTQRYAHLRDEALKNASNLMGEIISKTIEEKQNEKQTG